MRPLCSSRNGCAGVPATRVLSSCGAGDDQQAVQLAHVAAAGGVRLAVTALKNVRA